MYAFSKDSFLDQVLGNLLALKEVAEEANDREAVEAIDREANLAIDGFHSCILDYGMFPISHSLVDNPELYLRFYGHDPKYGC